VDYTKEREKESKVQMISIPEKQIINPLRMPFGRYKKCLIIEIDEIWIECITFETSN
jgi:hypothetical protein